jgi:hypothetical protein
MKLFQ